MTSDTHRHHLPFIELIYYLFEDAVERGEIPPGEYVTVISRDPLPSGEGTAHSFDNRHPHVSEPVSECHEHNGVVTITADLPGAPAEEIRHTLHNGVLSLAAHAGHVIYRAEYPVEEGAAETLVTTVKNGVIEFTYKKEGRSSEEIPSDADTGDVC